MSIQSYERKGDLGFALDDKGREIIFKHYPKKQFTKPDYFKQCQLSRDMCDGEREEVDWDNCNEIMEGYNDF